VDAGPARHPAIHLPFENGEGLVAIHTGTCMIHSMLKQETKLSKYQEMSMEELGSFVSDYHKDVHGFRPRSAGWKHADGTELTGGLYGNREALVAIAEGLDSYMEARRSTFAGRESMRADGWVVLETEPELIQHSIWLAQERDQVSRETEGGWWKESMSQAAFLRRQYGMED
jgi:hypothetical protein